MKIRFNMAISLTSSKEFTQPRVPLTFKNFLNKFSLEPLSKELARSDKIIAVVLVVLLNLATCFLFSLVAYLRSEKKVELLVSTQKRDQKDLEKPAIFHAEGVVSGVPLVRRITTTFEETIDKRWFDQVRGEARNPAFIEEKARLKIEELRQELRSGFIEEIQFIKELATVLVLIAYPHPISSYERKYPPSAYMDVVSSVPLERLIDKLQLEAKEKQDVLDLVSYNMMIFRGLQDFPNYKKFLLHPEMAQFSQDLLKRMPRLGFALSFQDQDILSVITNFEGHVFLQPGQRSCVTAAAAMMISDRLGRQIEFTTVDLEKESMILHMIHSNGLHSREVEVSTFKELRDSLIENGPACMGCVTIGSHEIVVDRVEFFEEGEKRGEPRAVHIRDPYHGWAIAVKPSAFLRCLDRSQDEKTFRKIKLIHAIR